MNITSWIFAAEINTQPVPPMTERINPELQIWRASTVVSNQLDLQSTVGVSEDPELISGSLYRYTPNDTVTVMPGDVLGISIAPMFGDPVTTFAPLFIDAGTGNTAEYFDDEFRSTGLVFIPTLENAGIEDRIGNQYVPLVTVEFGMIKYSSCTTYLHLCLFLFIPIHLFTYMYLSVQSLTSSFCITHVIKLLHRFSKPNIISCSTAYTYFYYHVHSLLFSLLFSLLLFCSTCMLYLHSHLHFSLLLSLFFYSSCVHVINDYTNDN